MRKQIALVLALMMVLVSMMSVAYAEEAPEQQPIADINQWIKAQADMLAPSEKQINIFTWTYYIPDEVVDEFSAMTGISVNYSATMGDNEEMKAKLISAPEAYDLLVVSDYIIGDLAALGLLHEYDREKIPNYLNIDPSYQSQYYDPDNLYSIPYTNTVPLLCYNADLVSAPIHGYADLWNEEYEGRLSIVAEMRAVIGMAQKKLGFSYNETDPEKMALVGQELATLKPNIMTFNSDVPHRALISGDATAGFMYGSQVAAARSMVPNMKVVYPAEGIGFGIDNLIVPKRAPHLDATYIFLNYLLDGKVSAATSDYIDYGNCNLAASEFMTPEFLADETINVPKELIGQAEMIMPIDAQTMKIYDEIWVNFRQ